MSRPSNNGDDIRPLFGEMIFSSVSAFIFATTLYWPLIIIGLIIVHAVIFNMAVLLEYTGTSRFVESVFSTGGFTL